MNLKNYDRRGCSKQKPSSDHPLTWKPKQTSPSRNKWTTMKRSIHAGKRYRENLSNFSSRKKKNHFHGSENIKTYFYVCLLEWKTWKSSTNNKLWWFQSDSTDFSRFFFFVVPPIRDHSELSEKPKQTSLRSWKSLPRENKLIKIVSPNSFPPHPRLPGMNAKKNLTEQLR